MAHLGKTRVRAYSESMRRPMWFVCCAAAFALSVGPAVAAADPIQLTIHDGRVSLVAKDVTVRQILAEWARVGHTRVVNGERVPGGVVTIELTNVPEQEALDLLLRTAGGYIAAPRSTAVTDASRFDRILILPTTTAPAVTATARPAAPAPVFAPPVTPPIFTAAGAQRVLGPDGRPVPDDQDDAPPPQPYVPLPPGFDGPTPPPARAFTPPAPAPGGTIPGPGAAPGPGTTPGSGATRGPGAPTTTGVPVPGMIVPPVTPPGPKEVRPLTPP
jgi:hypothetical protein